MAANTIRVNLKKWQDSLDDAVGVMKKIESGKTTKAKPSARYFQDLETARSVLTEGRLSLLRLIREKKPDSVADLARLAKRDFRGVYADVELLKDMGLVMAPKASRGKASALRSDATEIVFRIAV
jgi:predicted transcriptional regulator